MLDSMSEIFAEIERTREPFWEVILRTNMLEQQISREASLEKMRAAWHAMQEADITYEPDLRSVSGLVGGDGGKMRAYAAERGSLCGSFLSDVIAVALRTGESNACMRKIVAAPTAGSCGVLPAVLIPTWWKNRIPEEKIIQAMFVAAGIGSVIGTRASISGAAGGCQAEIGSASAMAAGALVAIHGGDHRQIGHAAAMALKNLMGLICDPLGGLVEVPCVKRNVIGAVNAVSCADMALAGIESRIPVDEVIDCMGDVGRRMPVEFRETAMGGLAVTPFGLQVKEMMEKK